MAKLESGVKRAALLASPSFEAMQPGEVDTVLQMATERQVRRGQTIFQKGDEGGSMMAVLQGRVRISAVSADGKEVTLNVKAAEKKVEAPPPPPTEAPPPPPEKSAFMRPLPLIGFGIAYFIYWLGQLPGEIAHSRGHPQATAIAACGWIGLIFPPLWPIAFVWAFLVPAGRDLEPPADLTGIQAGLKAAAARLLEIEGKLGKAGAA